jgi:hypothetical protein
MNEIEKGYRRRSDLRKDENGDLLEDSYNILNRWKNCCQLLNVLGINDVRQTELH